MLMPVRSASTTAVSSVASAARALLRPGVGLGTERRNNEADRLLGEKSSPNDPDFAAVRSLLQML